MGSGLLLYMEGWQGERDSLRSQAAGPAMVLKSLGQSGLNYQRPPKPAGAQAKAHRSPGHSQVFAKAVRLLAALTQIITIKATQCVCF